MKNLLVCAAILATALCSVPASARDAHGLVPMAFLRDSGNAWRLHGAPYHVTFSTRGGALIRRGDSEVRVSLLGAAAISPQPSSPSYELRRFHGPVSTYDMGFGVLEYSQVLPGVDLRYRADRPDGNLLEFDLIIHPEADPSRVEIAFEGAPSRLNEKGDVAVRLKDGSELLQTAPVAFQQGPHGRSLVHTRWVALRDRPGVYRIAVGSYDRARALVIDPVLTYGSFVPSADIALDPRSMKTFSDGRVFVVGNAQGSPTDPALNAYPGQSWGSDAFVAEFAPTGRLTAITYFGGGRNDTAYDISEGPDSYWVVGTTESTGAADLPMQDAMYGFPALGDPGFQDTNPQEGQPCAFATRFWKTGGIMASTFIGGQTHAYSVISESDASASVLVQANDWVPRPDGTKAFQNQGFNFIHIGPAGKVMITSLTPNYDTSGRGRLFRKDAGEYWVVSGTSIGDGVRVNKFSPTPDMATPIGQPFFMDQARLHDVTYTPDDRIYLLSYVDPGLVAPTTSDAPYPTNPGGAYHFARVGPTGALELGSYLSASDASFFPKAIHVLGDGRIVLAGEATDQEPTANPLQAFGGGWDAFIKLLGPDLIDTYVATHFGGTGYEKLLLITGADANNLWFIGESSDYVQFTPDAEQPGFVPGYLSTNDTFVMRLASDDQPVAGGNLGIELTAKSAWPLEPPVAWDNPVDLTITLTALQQGDAIAGYDFRVSFDHEVLRWLPTDVELADMGCELELGTTGYTALHCVLSEQLTAETTRTVTARVWLPDVTGVPSLGAHIAASAIMQSPQTLDKTADFTVPVATPEADLAVSKDSKSQGVLVTNNGPHWASLATLAIQERDKTFSSINPPTAGCDSWQVSGRDLTCEIEKLDPSASRLVHIRLENGFARVSSTTPDPDLSNNESAIGHTAPLPDPEKGCSVSGSPQERSFGWFASAALGLVLAARRRRAGRPGHEPRVRLRSDKQHRRGGSALHEPGVANG